MDEKRDANTEENQRTEPGADDASRGERESGIGARRKAGLYGCGFLLLALVIMLIVLIITGIYVPFPSNEGVGP